MSTVHEYYYIVLYCTVIHAHRSTYQGRSYHWGLGGQAPPPPPIGLAPPPMILVIVQYSLLAIAKILLLNAVNGRFDS